MVTRDTPWGAHNFLVDIGDGPDTASALGGFSDVSGLGTEVTLIEYRQGNDREMRVRKLPGLHKTSDVTLKRGVMGVRNFWDWIRETRTSPNTARPVLITMLDEMQEPVLRWKLVQARPMKWTGPTLAAKGGSDVAMEELVIAAEGFEWADV
jgi:phage tail-like protein